MSEKQYGVALVGAGVIAPVHAEALAALPNARLVAVCDVARDKADALAAKYGAEPVYDLEALLARPGRVMSKEQLASQVFGLDEEASPDAIEIYIHRVRKKLEGSGVHIVTFRGLGYLLKAADG